MQRRPPAYFRLLGSADPMAQRLRRNPDIRLMYLDARGLPTYYGTSNRYAAGIINTDKVWPGGIAGYELNGLGTVAGQLAIWDAGAVRATHQEFGGRVAQMDTAVTTHPHATHVSGTLVAGGVDPAARGMSYRAPLHAYEWDDDLAEMAAAAAQGLLVSNHSYGMKLGWLGSNSLNWFGDVSVSVAEDYRFGFYGQYARALDEIAYNAPNYLMVRSSGNDADDTGPAGGGSHYHLEDGIWVEATDFHQTDAEDASKEDTIPETACAKNILTVGAIGEDQWGSPTPTAFTSSGPTDDGRIKPDVVAQGEDVWSPTNGSDTSYQFSDGTSMASPGVAGSVNLLVLHYMDHYGKVALSSSMRALVIHTAGRVRLETPPTARLGWGKMDTRAAADLIAGDTYGGGGIMEAVLEQGETHTYRFGSSLTGERFTIAWTDPPGVPPSASVDPPTPMLVNDLDMRVQYSRTGTILEPILKDWSVPPPRDVLNGDNSVDNVERIEGSSPGNDQLSVTITHKGSLTGGAQAYSLIYGGTMPRQPVPPAAGIYGIGVVDLAYPGAAPSEGTAEHEERGIIFTAIRGFDLDAVGFRVAIPCQNTITARLYSRNGGGRGTLLASGSVESHAPGDVFHYVPLNYTLEPCQSYELAMEYEEAIRWWLWDKNAIELPYDVAGVVRVTNSQWNGSTTTPVLARFALAGRALGTGTTSDLTPPGTTWDSSTDDPGERGVFVTAGRTATVSALRWGASVPAFSSNGIEASIYEADGTTRGALIARTSTALFSTGSSMRMFTVPINATLKEGQDYEFSVTFAPSSFQVKHESAVAFPYTVDGVLTVVGGGAAGDPADTLLTHFGVVWSAGAGGTFHDLAKADVPSTAGPAGGAPGALIEALADDQLYSVGWMADVPAGAVLGTRVYEFTSFFSAPALLAEGEILSGAGGMRWHDIPVGVQLSAGRKYILEMVPSAMDAWESWSDLGGMPYTTAGVVNVIEGVLDRAAGGDRLPHARISLCSSTATGVADPAGTAPSFSLAAPSPNPLSGRARIDYQLMEPDRVWIHVYDVAGRRVVTLVDGARRPAGAGTEWLDASALPAGIYFLQMRYAGNTLTRKMTIVK